MTQAEEILEAAAGVMIGLFAAFLLVILIWEVLAKEHPQQIRVVRKRETLHRSVPRSAGQADYYTHYTIDCTFPGSDKVHTLDCKANEFYRMEKGGSYTVLLRRMTIRSVVKKQKH
ncbi:MAG: hypothetical protein IJ055_01310 [Oscillospiraceae bacterium]|nr:hypothetical protein [Oscillospiraceae bacterium]